MLVISSEKMRIFRHQALERFEHRMIDCLAHSFPDPCAKLDLDILRERVRLGIERAGRWGLTAEYDVARYIALMHILGPDFDTAPETSWVSPLLASSELEPDEKLDEIWARTTVATADWTVGINAWR